MQLSPVIRLPVTEAVLPLTVASSIAVVIGVILFAVNVFVKSALVPDVLRRRGRFFSADLWYDGDMARRMRRP